MSRDEILRQQYMRSAQRNGLPLPCPESFGAIPVLEENVMGRDGRNSNGLTIDGDFAVSGHRFGGDEGEGSGFFSATEAEIGELVDAVRYSDPMRSVRMAKIGEALTPVHFEVEDAGNVGVWLEDGHFGSKVIAIGGGAVPYAQLAALVFVKGLETGNFESVRMLLSAIPVDEFLTSDAAWKLARQSGLLSLLGERKLRQKCLLVSGGMLIWAIAREFVHAALGHKPDICVWNGEQESEADELATRILDADPFASYSFEARMLWLNLEVSQETCACDEEDEATIAQQRLDALLRENPRKARKYEKMLSD